MKLIKIIFGIVLFLVIIYSLSMLFIDEDNKFSLSEEINYPIDKIYPQFADLQNFTQWNTFFTEKENYSFTFFAPYEGQGSSMKFSNQKKQNKFGEIFLRYANPQTSLKYQLYQGNANTPFEINVKFVPKKEKTLVIWNIAAPHRSFFKRSLNLVGKDLISETVSSSMVSLSKLLGSKIDREVQIASIKYDTIMKEQKTDELLIGISATSVTLKKEDLLKNIILNHNKVISYVSKDLGKKPDEYGEPTLICENQAYKNNEVSYYIGVPVSSEQPITDNNFIYRKTPPSQNYFSFYKGKYPNRTQTITNLLAKIKKDSLRGGNIYETFIEPPEENSDCILKISVVTIPLPKKSEQ